MEREISTSNVQSRTPRDPCLPSAPQSKAEKAESRDGGNRRRFRDGYGAVVAREGERPAPGTQNGDGFEVAHVETPAPIKVVPIAPWGHPAGMIRRRASFLAMPSRRLSRSTAAKMTAPVMTGYR